MKTPRVETQKSNKRFWLVSTVHMVCQALLWTQLLVGPQSMAQSNSNTNNERQAPLTETELEGKTSEGMAHEEKAKANGGLWTSCQEQRNTSLIYDNQDRFSNEMQNQNLGAIGDQASVLFQQNQNLATAQGDFVAKNLGYVDETVPMDEEIKRKEKEYKEAKIAWEAAKNREQVARAAYNAAVSSCSNHYCSYYEQQKVNETKAAWELAKTELQKTTIVYNQKRSAYKGRFNNALSDGQSATNNMENNANQMAASHSLSGCNGITTIGSAEKGCTLSGPVFEADQKLTDLANANINEARKLAAERSNMLLEMELKEKYAADYRLYEIAVEGSWMDPKYAATNGLDANAYNGIETLDQIDNLSQTDPRKTRDLALTISNIKTMGLASAGVKDTLCEQHDMSEADAKSYHVFRAAMATWLMAIINDADYYAGSSNCRATEDYELDETNNEQIRTVERAANLTQQQLENTCLRINPYVDPKSEDGYDWRYYGKTEAEASENMAKLASLKKECDQYLDGLRGPEYTGKARTREFALQMMGNALTLAFEELAAKREKIAIAYANVQKGKAWVKRVKKDIQSMLLLYALLMAAARVFYSIPFCGGCPMGAKLTAMAGTVMAVIIGVKLMSELSRAKKFLAKWQKKLHHAKYFTHLACNFEDAKAEENAVAQLGQAAKEKKRKEIQEAEARAIENINLEVNERLPLSSTQQSGYYFLNPETRLMVETFKDKVIEGVVAYKKGLDFLGHFFESQIFINSAIAQDESAPVDPTTMTRSEKRDQTRLAGALNVAEGSESFRYFLVQKNLQWQNQTNDITDQPEHTRNDAEIANAGSGQKNVRNGIIKSVDALAAPFMGGDGSDPIADLKADEKTGFPTPETRVVTIQNAFDMMTENIHRMNGALTDIQDQRDQYVQLLNDMRARMKINDMGVGETQLIPNPSPKPVCMVGEIDDPSFDSTCGCTNSNSCTNFAYPKFEATVPSALKTGGRLSTDTANSILSGDLAGANINGGKLVANAANLRKSLVDAKNKVNEGRKKAGLPPRDFSQESRDLSRATENNVTKGLANTGVDTNNNTLLNRVRNNLLNEGINDKDKDSNKDKNKETKSLASNSSSSGVIRGTSGARSGSSKNIDKNKTSSESFSLVEGGGNLNLEGLTDEERAQLGLAGANHNAKARAGGKDSDNHRYQHQRQLTDSGHSKLSKNDPFYGIHKNRNKSLFQIISKRYEKTAFPVFLVP